MASLSYDQLVDIAENPPPPPSEAELDEMLKKEREEVDMMKKLAKKEVIARRRYEDIVRCEKEFLKGIGHTLTENLMILDNHMKDPDILPSDVYVKKWAEKQQDYNHWQSTGHEISEKITQVMRGVKKIQTLIDIWCACMGKLIQEAEKAEKKRESTEKGPKKVKKVKKERQIDMKNSRKEKRAPKEIQTPKAVESVLCSALSEESLEELLNPSQVGLF